MEEPSVLDFVKSLLTPWKGERIRIPDLTPEKEGIFAESIGNESTANKNQAISEIRYVEANQVAGIENARWSFPWKTVTSLFLFLLAQISFGPPVRSPGAGFLFLLCAFVFLYLAYSKNEIIPSPEPSPIAQIDPRTISLTTFITGILFALLTFLTSGGNRFSYLNLAFLLLSVLFVTKALWLGENKPVFKPLKFIFPATKQVFTFSLTNTALLLMIASLIVIFFRLYKLDSVPPEMVSDHAEKYLDINDILNNQTHIFFPRNGGREALQFYLVAGIHKLFGNEYSFLTLKISTVIVGLLALPFFYLVGNEIGNFRVGFTTFTFAGIAYWLNVVSRSGMRLPFYFLFTGAVMYYFLKGVRLSNRNYFLLSGLFLGLSFYGYSANRILPLLLIIGLLIYLMHQSSRGNRSQVVWQFSLLGLSAFIIFIPLLRYIFQDPDGYFGRMFSRLIIAGGEISALPALIFIENNIKALSMFSWSGGVVWVTSIPDFPALDFLMGSIFYVGLGLVIFRYFRDRHWQDLFLIVSIPILMLPSTLSLAFPMENPNLHRTAGAAIPVFVMIGVAMDGILSGIETHIFPRWNYWISRAVFAILFVFAAVLNYNLVFDVFNKQYELSAQNTREMGEVIRSFSETIGNPDQAWVIGYPHWADTRLVSIAAGYFNTDLAIFSDQLQNTVDVPAPKLFIVHPLDEQSIKALASIYPQGWFENFESEVDSKDFKIFFVPKSDLQNTFNGNNNPDSWTP